MPRLAPLVAVLLIAFAVACGGGASKSNDTPDAKASPTPADSAASNTKPSTEPTTAASGAVTDEPVKFETADGVTISGHLYSTAGPKRKVVVLAHEFPTNQKAWTAFAKELAGRGVHALTFDFRGYGETGGSKDVAKIDRDLESAVRFIRSRDYAQVYVIGASMGGTAALKVAARLDLAGVVTISTPASIMGLDASQDVPKIAEPKLFMAGTRDDGGAYADDAHGFMSASPAPKSDAYFDSDKHGTQLFTGGDANLIRKLIFDFLGI